MFQQCEMCGRAGWVALHDRLLAPETLKHGPISWPGIPAAERTFAE